jgi:hypothetical protein
VTRDIRALAIKYVDEVVEDQRRLGYTGRVRAEAREKAIADVEATLRGLAASASGTKRAVAA